MQRWTFAFAFAGETNRLPSLVKETPGRQTFDGFNDVAWMELKSCGTLAVTWFGTSTDEADIAINTRFIWTTSSDPAVSAAGTNVFDLETVLLHENGHVAGLSHSEDLAAVMHSTYHGWQRALHADDIAGVISLYPSGGAPPPPPPPPPADVDAPDTVLVETDKAVYVNRERVSITVTVTDVNGDAVSGTAVEVLLTTANGRRLGVPKAPPMPTAFSCRRTRSTRIGMAAVPTRSMLRRQTTPGARTDPPRLRSGGGYGLGGSMRSAAAMLSARRRSRGVFTLKNERRSGSMLRSAPSGTRRTFTSPSA